MQGHASILKEQNGDLSPNNLNAIMESAERASEICDQMLAYSGQGHFFMEPVDVNSLVADSVPPGLAEVMTDAAVPPINAAPAQLRQLIGCLLDNAQDATNPGRNPDDTELARRQPDIRVCVDSAKGDEEFSGQAVKITVLDNGVGMSEDVRQKIFEPYYSTRFVGRGLGMSAVEGIVRGHGGEICVESAPGQGTRVDVYLPVGEPGVQGGRKR